MGKGKLRRVVKIVLNDIAGFYPYFFGFYVVSLILSFFFKSWGLFFNWPAFDVLVIVLGAVSLFSERFKTFVFGISGLERLKKLAANAERSIWGRTKLFLTSAVIVIAGFSRNLADKAIGVFLERIRRLRGRDYVKLGLVLIVVVYALRSGIGVIDFIVLLYALISVLFVLDSRIAAGAALVLLISCPVFLIFKKDAIAEVLAVYAYYFLVVTVMTQIGEYLKEKKLSTVRDE